MQEKEKRKVLGSCTSWHYIKIRFTMGNLSTIPQAGAGEEDTSIF
jgi:hypothetical protein